MARELICIVCPAGCHIKVDDDGKISGYTCEKGLNYATNEVTAPKRVITSTVKVEGGIHRRLPVKTNGTILKGDIEKAMKLLNGLTVKAPIKTGDVIVKDVLGSGVDFVSSRDM